MAFDGLHLLILAPDDRFQTLSCIRVKRVLELREHAPRIESSAIRVDGCLDGC